MKDLYSVLLEKEIEMERVRQEIEALRSVLPLLSEDHGDANAKPESNNKWPIEVTGSR